MSPRVLVSVESQVAHVRLNRPEKRNGLDLALFEALVETGLALAADKAVRAVVLSGEGPAFCAGLDWASFLAMGGAGPARLLARDTEKSPANLAQRAAWVWQELAVPVIAAVHGATYGGGLQLALAADLRYGAPDTQLSVMEIRYGLVPDMSISQTLPRLVRADIARELVFTGRVVEAEEAARIGLLTRVVERPVEEALAAAGRIAGQSPEAVRAAKRLMQAPLTDPLTSFTLETELQLPLLGSPNQMEAVTATMSRRAPVFRDPS
jgi:enoyl-CoA hydratase/carnithine racemase